jgi:hypothetical protein
MTALRSHFIPLEETVSFAEQRAHDFQVMIGALNEPAPLGIVGVMRLEEHLRGTSFGLRLLPQSVRQRRSKTIPAPLTRGAT